MSTIGELTGSYAALSLGDMDDLELNWEGGTLDLGSLSGWWSVTGPFEIEPNGGIGDGAGPIPTGDGPFPVEPDGGIGDGAGPFPGGDQGDETDGDITILPFPLPTDPDDDNSRDDDGGIAGPDTGDPIPVEPDGGIGDGAGPIPGDGEPIPIEGPGGIGDGAVGIPENNIFGGGAGTTGNDFFYGTEESETFIFKADHGYDMITDFDIEADRLDLSGTEIDFTDLESLLRFAKDDVDPDGNIYGVMIETSDSSGIYIADISAADLAFALIDF